MMTYEAWDKVADSYIPVLFVLYLVWSVIYFRAGDRLAAARGLAGVLLCYLLMVADHFLGLWKMFTLDYSTHTAVAFALVFFHLHKRRFASPAAAVFTASLLLYFLLMLHQRYHTPLDIMTTLAVVVPVVLLGYLALGWKWQSVYRRKMK